MAFSTDTLPQYVSDYFGVRSPGRIKMIRLQRDSANPREWIWEFRSPERSITTCARTAAQARENLKDLVCRICPKQDRRRKHWQYT